MPKAAAIHPESIEPGLPPLEEPVSPGAAPPVAPPPQPENEASHAGLPAGLDIDVGARRLRDLVVSHPLASLGATLAVGASLGILLKRLR